MDYTILWSEDTNIKDCIDGLKKQVKDKIKEGWRPQGGISITTDNDELSYTCIASQAMVKGK